MATVVASFAVTWRTSRRQQLAIALRLVLSLSVASSGAGPLEALTDDDFESYWDSCLASVVSEDVQQLAVAAALAVVVGDSEIDASEMSGIARLCDAWDVDVSDAEAIWND